MGPEAELVRELALGRPEAFERLVARYERPLMGFIGATVGDAAAAEDIFQETFVRVIRSIGDYRPQAGLATWIFTIARNLALDHLRRRKRRREVPLNVIPMPRPGPEAALQAAERSDKLRDAMARLAPKKREVLALRFFANMGYEEMAGLLGAPEGTLKFRVHEALRELSASLKSVFGEESHELSGSA
jgi:RNA polymerase sigma-70 factor (ECF subfamily)